MQLQACSLLAACHLSLLFWCPFLLSGNIITMLISLAIILTLTPANLPLQLQGLCLTSLKVTLNCSLVRIPKLYPSLLHLMRL